MIPKVENDISGGFYNAERGSGEHGPNIGPVFWGSNTERFNVTLHVNMLK